MSMSLRERLLAVYQGRQPDVVPALADLSYWHAAHGGGKFIPGKTDGANREKVDALLDLHRRTGTAIHLNLGSFYRETHASSMRVHSGIRSGAGGEEYFHRFETPVGTVEEVREWSEITHSWPIIHHMVATVEDLKVVRYAFEHIAYQTNWDEYENVKQRVGELGVVVVGVPYTGSGFLMSRYAGIETTVLMSFDEPEELQATIATINTAHEKVFRLMAEGPCEVIMVSDNLSSDVQSPAWFHQYSAAHYREMARLAHANDKRLITHIDGRLRGLLGLVAELGVDGADAVTPAPLGDLTPAQCRAEAGRKFVLSGGVPPDAFNPAVPLEVFDQRVEAWLALAKESPALIIAPGDQLPPDGDIERVTRMARITEAYKF
jgi:uroporphyrinogen-III decarboxylase